MEREMKMGILNGRRLVCLRWDCGILVTQLCTNFRMKSTRRSFTMFSLIFGHAANFSAFYLLHVMYLSVWHL